MGPFSPDQKLGATILSHSPWILRLIIAVSRLTRCKVFQVQSVNIRTEFTAATDPDICWSRMHLTEELSN
jgi:hypothetical protein